MYLNDIATIPVNLAGNCAMSLPIGLAPEDGLPVGLQIIAPAMADDRLYRVGSALEAALVDDTDAAPVVMRAGPALNEVLAVVARLQGHE